VLFICDGNYSGFVEDVAACGVHGFFLEPHTDLGLVARRYGRTHVLIGNADTRVLLSGDRRAIRAEVERCMAVGKACPGYFMGVTNMIPANTPVEAALYYNQCYEELSRR
jgi:uroporphyrinogen-III decarboxylase